MSGLMILALAGGCFLVGHLVAWGFFFYLAGRQAIRERQILNGDYGN